MRAPSAIPAPVTPRPRRLVATTKTSQLENPSTVSMWAYVFRNSRTHISIFFFPKRMLNIQASLVSLDPGRIVLGTSRSCLTSLHLDEMLIFILFTDCAFAEANGKRKQDVSKERVAHLNPRLWVECQTQRGSSLVCVERHGAW